MEHSYRWLNRTRLSVNMLEDRMQPGSLLTGGMDLSLLGDMLPRPVETNTEAMNILAVKRVENTEVQTVAAPAAVETEARVAQSISNVISNKAQKPAQTIDVGFTQNTQVKAAQQVNPAFAAVRPASQQVDTNTAPAAMVRNGDQLTRPAELMRQSVAPRLTSAPVRHELNVEVRPYMPTLDSVPCDGGNAGPEALTYTSYDGTAGTDVNNGIAGGKQGQTGQAYAVGGHDGAGSFTRLLSSGACDAASALADSTNTGVAVNAYTAAPSKGGVYAVGNTSLGESYILRLDPTDPTLTTVLAGWIYSAPAGGSISFNGVGISPNGQFPDVSISGTFNDGVLGYENHLTIRYDTLLTDPPVYAVYWDYGAASGGLSVDMDRPRNAYHGMYLDDGTGRYAAFSRIDADGTQTAWGGAWYFPATADARNGMYGAKFIGGATAATGVYMSGAYRDDGFNPGVENLLLIKADAATGGAGDYYLAYGITAEDYQSGDSAADRDGNHYTGGFFTATGDTGGDLSKWDVAGNPLEFRTYGSVGTSTRGSGVDLSTTSPTSDAMFTGTTNDGALGFGGGCDLTYNGGASDGLISKDAQPLGF